MELFGSAHSMLCRWFRPLDQLLGLKASGHGFQCSGNDNFLKYSLLLLIGFEGAFSSEKRKRQKNVQFDAGKGKVFIISYHQFFSSQE
jgi:hypothetical protein